MKDRRTLTILVLPDGAERPRTVRLSYSYLRLLFGSGALALLLLTGVAGSWWHLTSRAQRVTALEAEVVTLREDQARIGALARQFAEVEARYEHLRGLFGAETLAEESGVWLPPLGDGAAPGSAGSGTEERERPTSWPLTQRGFLTQPLLEGTEGAHPGVDIAIPSGSYIRAAGPGTVVELGEDPVYGYFVVLEHGEGYRSLYGHASLLLVERGAVVRRNEVIALTGSTGRSTAPHLHFEILRDGEPVDPLTMVDPP